METFKWVVCGFFTGAAGCALIQGAGKGMPSNPEQWGAIAAAGVFALLANAWRPA